MSSSLPSSSSVSTSSQVSERPSVVSDGSWEQEIPLEPSSASRRSRSSTKKAASAWEAKMSGAVVFALLAVTLPFGSVHIITQSAAVIALSLAAIASLLMGTTHRLRGATVMYILGLFCFGGFVLLHCLLTQTGSNHPLGSAFQRNLIPEFSEHFLPGFTLFLAGFFLADRFLVVRSKLSTPSRDSRHSRYLSAASHFSFTAERNLVFLGVGIALIALGHWLTDNGKLFWYFTPIHEGGSNRARWPFVNPNHLGFFLLPFFFLSLSFGLKKILSLIEIYYEARHRKQAKEKIVELLGKQEVQQQVGGFGIALIGSLAILLALVATLSRATWIGLFLGTVAFAALTLRTLSDYEAQIIRSATRSRKRRSTVEFEAEEYSFQSSVVQPGTQSMGGSVKFSLLLSCCFGALLFLLSIFLLGLGEGHERIEQRFAFGLISSVEDMRWQMFLDSWPLLSFWGIGFSRWDEVYQTILSTGMAGLHPRYLHSEPFQILIELGAIGFLIAISVYFLPLAVLVREFRSYLTRYQPIYTAERRQSLYSRLFASALIAAWISISVAICFDFSLRVPANLLLLSVLSALTISTASELKAQSSD